MAASDGDEWEEIRPGKTELEGEALTEPMVGESAVASEYPEAPTRTVRGVRVGDRSRYAMVSGLGFFVLAVAVYFLVVVPGDVVLAELAAAGMGLTAATAYFWMADDLRIGPKRLSRSATRFIAGPLLGLLAIVGLATFVAYVGNGARPGGWGAVVTVFGLELGTAATVSLLFYSMLWDE